MSDITRTEHADFKFRVSEFERGAYVSTEPIHENEMKVLSNQTGLFFELRDDSIENARRVAAFMNEHISNLGVTVFKGHPMFSTIRER